jgi:hypothetical protein
VFAGLGVLAVVLTVWLTDVGWDGMLMEMLSWRGILVAVLTGAAGFGLGTPAAVGVVCFGLVVFGWIEDRRLEREAKRLLERRAALVERGVDVVGKVTALEKSNWTINDKPLVTVTIEVPLADGRVATLSEQRVVEPEEVKRLEAGPRVRVRYVPDDLDNHQLDFGPEPALPTVSGTGAQLEGPLWTFGTEKADAWMLPARRDGTSMVVIRVSDPHHEGRDAISSMTVECAALVLAELLWMRTDLRAIGVVFVNLEEKKLVQPCGAAPSFEDLQPFLRSLDEPPIVLWGHAEPDLDKQGLSVRVRLPGSEVEHAFSAPLLELGDTLRDFLLRKGLCSTTEPPAWWRAPDAESLPRHVLLMHNLTLQILADERNRALPPLKHDFVKDIVSCALEEARTHRDQTALTAVLSAVYASRAKRLQAAHRLEALELVRDAAEPHPIHRLAPLFLAELGEPLEAKSRRAELGKAVDARYRAWLQAIEAVDA